MTLYISDLDGTLLSDSGKLKPRTADMLNDFIENGVNFTYCTARRINSAGVIMKDVRLNVPVILMNGVFIYDTQKKEYIKRNVPDDNEVLLLKRTIVNLGERPMVHSLIDGELRCSYIKGSKSLKNYVNDRKSDKSMRAVESYDGLFDGEPYYAVFINPENKDELDRIFCPENGFNRVYYEDTYHKGEFWYEVFSARASKANAVLQLKEIMGADEIVAFGDNGNDLSMFSVADRKYAVGNAIDEVKSVADAVIGTNESFGVTEFIQKEIFTVFDYERPEKSEVDEERFRSSLERSLSRERTTIGTLNEKTIHNTLKGYYGDEIDHEARIGEFYADAAGENGIFEIQTANFNKLNRKLSKMLRACHVTVIYPFERIVNNYSVNENTGEVISSSTRRNRDYSKFFLELYRIKAYITNPNLTICVAELEIDKKQYYKDARRIRYRGMRKEKFPVRYIREIRLDNKVDYGIFIPDGLPEVFTKKELQQLCRPTDAALLLETLEHIGLAVRVGKNGNAVLYSVAL